MSNSVATLSSANQAQLAQHIKQPTPPVNNVAPDADGDNDGSKAGGKTAPLSLSGLGSVINTKA
jgi:hypothetical protein